MAALEAALALEKADVVAKAAEVGNEEHNVAILRGMNARLPKAATNGHDSDHTAGSQAAKLDASQEALKGAKEAAAGASRESEVASEAIGRLRKSNDEVRSQVAAELADHVVATSECREAVHSFERCVVLLLQPRRGSRPRLSIRSCSWGLL